MWRQPEEDFNTNSTLIVMPGEEAIFIKGGVVEQRFENGTYKLSTENYPFISRLRNAMTGGISTFNCVVYFFRVAHSQEIPWGTSTPLKVRDKYLGITTEVKARGSYKVSITNPVIFLEKMVGNNIPYQTQSDMRKYFATQFQSKVRSVLTRALNDLDSEIIGIEGRLDEFSDHLQPLMNEMLDEYGLRCVQFIVSAMDVADNALRDSFDSTQIGNINRISTAQSTKKSMDIMGDDWSRFQSAGILKDLANNPNSGGIAAAGAGLGMGLAAGESFGGLAHEMFNKSGPSASENFSADPFEKLSKLKKLLEAGLIEQAEYEAKKAEILEEM